MTRKRVEDQRTRARLVAVATKQFAARGFKRVTIRALSREARANVAAVNYHFGDKLGLYREVIESAVAVVRETTDLAIRAGAGLAPEEQLRAYIRVQCERMFALGGHNLLHQLIYREMNDPTEVFTSFIDRALRPRHEYLARVVGAVLGLPPDDERVGLSAASIQAQIVMFRPNPIVDRIRAQLKLAFSPGRVAEHIACFSLAALKTEKLSAISCQPSALGRQLKS